AMKMENVIKATSNGAVKDVSVAAGNSVDKGDKLLELE
ncbi:MAG: acetyl-CoA carboxylase biotin carboxyl carrier protein subunit, partial [candidate division Zixibacteria bacterium]|nr:acetyl-CoA carboxylase biotin carboxyl carrier protein subunit [candidate division Zixibacteria bacterium]